MGADTLSHLLAVATLSRVISSQLRASADLIAEATTKIEAMIAEAQIKSDGSKPIEC